MNQSPWMDDEVLIWTVDFVIGVESCMRKTVSDCNCVTFERFMKWI